MFDRVTNARLQDEATIREAVKAYREGFDSRYFAIINSNRDLAARIIKAALGERSMGEETRPL